MQLGTRWAMGGEPPARLSEQVVAAIRDVESTSIAPAAIRYWTLTWLEGRPVLELDPAPGSDAFITIRVNSADETTTITSYDSGDELVEE